MDCGRSLTWVFWRPVIAFEGITTTVASPRRRPLCRGHRFSPHTGATAAMPGHTPCAANCGQ